MLNKRKTIVVAALIITGLLVTYPVRSLIAGCYFHRATSILDEKGSAMPLTRQAMPDYFEALRALERASAVAPSASRYPRALSDLYIRIGTWTAAMELTGAPLPEGAMNSKDAFQAAEVRLRTAIRLEPANPDYHFALGYLYDVIEKGSGRAEKELSRAIAAYPANAALRYAVASQHLRYGRKGDAIEQAAMLAKIVDKNTPGNYLVKAFDIAWRASGNSQVVKGICPDEPGARQAVQKFLELKGVREETGPGVKALR